MTKEEKVEAVKLAVPNYATINPFNWSDLDKVKRAICGTAILRQKYTETSDTAVINLILRAQGKMPERVCVASGRKKQPRQ